MLEDSLNSAFKSQLRHGAAYTGTGQLYGDYVIFVYSDQLNISAVGLKGSLTAYKGATGMDANLGKQIGSSRITCALSVLRHLGTMTGSQPTDDANVVWTL